MCQTDRLQRIGRPHEHAHTQANDQVASVEVRDDALVEDGKHDQRCGQKAYIEQREHRNGAECVLHSGKGVAPDDRHRKKQNLPEQRRACAGAPGNTARAQILTGYWAIGQVFDFVGSVLGHGTSSHSIWAWCPHAYGCVPPHGQIKTGRTGPPARPATVTTTKQPTQSSPLKRRQSEPRCFANVTLSR